MPKNLDVSHSVRDMLESNWDLGKLSQICEQSLMWRSKPSLARTWLQRLKKANWMQLLSGRILRPSMQSRFETEYTSSLAVIRVNPSQSPDSERENQTLDTFGRILRESFRQLDLFGASLRTSQDTLRLDSPQFIKAYDLWVTQLRQDCLVRQSVEHHTDGNGCLSWPTIQIADAKQCKFNKRGNPHLGMVAGNWATPEARNQEGYQVVNGKKIPRLAQQANWPTPNVPNRGKELSKNHRPKSGGIDLQSTVGLLAQDSPNTNGKNRGLWTSPSKDDINRRRGKYKQGGTVLNTQTKGKLNPDWVEQLMGLVVGWTDFDFSAMELCPNKQKKHLDT